MACPVTQSGQLPEQMNRRSSLIGRGPAELRANGRTRLVGVHRAPTLDRLTDGAPEQQCLVADDRIAGFQEVRHGRAGELCVAPRGGGRGVDIIGIDRARGRSLVLTRFLQTTIIRVVEQTTGLGAKSLLLKILDHIMIHGNFVRQAQKLGNQTGIYGHTLFVQKVLIGQTDTTVLLRITTVDVQGPNPRSERVGHEIFLTGAGRTLGGGIDRRGRREVITMADLVPAPTASPTLEADSTRRLEAIVSTTVVVVAVTGWLRSVSGCIVLDSPHGRLIDDSRLGMKVAIVGLQHAGNIVLLAVPARDIAKTQLLKHGGVSGHLVLVETTCTRPLLASSIQQEAETDIPCC